MTKAGAWSYSRMKNFETCPKQYYHVTVLKEHPFQETAATRYGNEFHKAAEYFMRDGTPVPERFSFTQPILDSLAAKPGKRHCELKMGLTADLEPCGFFDKNIWFRGIVDLLIVDGDRAFIVDYKTGKSAKYADKGQLELMALCVFKHFPEVKRVKAGLVFVVADAFVKEDYAIDQEGALWKPWISRYSQLSQAHENDVWNPKPSGLCRKHCPVLQCHHNGQNE